MMPEKERDLMRARDQVDSARIHVAVAIDKLCITVMHWQSTPLLFMECQRFLDHSKTLLQIYKDLNEWLEETGRRHGDASTKT